MLLTTEQAKSLDKATLGEPNSRLNFLMKNAGTHIADETKILVKDIEKPLIFILCGKGNNGGDCFAAASILHQDGYSILLHSIVDEIQIKDDSLDFYLDCKSKNIPISFGCLPKHLGNIDLIIDGLVGIGLKGKLKNDIKPISNWINNTDVKVYNVLEKLRTAGDEIETREAWMEKLVSIVKCPDCEGQLEVVNLSEGPRVQCSSKTCNFGWP